MITVLVAPGALAGERLALAGDSFHHLVRVRRLAAGTRLRLVDGTGSARWGTLAEVGRREAEVVLAEAAPTFEPARRVELLVAPPRPERASWLIEKATELGVAAVRFVATARDPRAIGSGSLARLQRVAAAALEQCGGSRLPELSGVHRFDELPTLLAPLSTRLVLDFGGAPFPLGEVGAAALLVGPEGGFTDDERAQLAALGCRAVALGERVLRVETAAVAAAALALVAGSTSALR